MIHAAVVLLTIAGVGVDAGASREKAIEIPSNTIYALQEHDGNVVMGTAKGIYMVETAGEFAPENGRRIETYDKPVLDFAYAGEGIAAAATSSGPMFFNLDDPEDKPVGAPLLDEFVSAVAITRAPESRYFFGGTTGLMEMTRTGKIARIETPGAAGANHGREIVTALATSGPDLFVAVDGNVYLYRGLRDEWLTVAAGATYTQLTVLDERNLLGLAISGRVDLLSRPVRGVVWDRRDFPAPGNATVTVVTLAGGELLLGTYDGAVYSRSALVGSAAAGGEDRESGWRTIVRPFGLPMPVTALLRLASGLTLVGTAGHGLLALQLGGAEAGSASTPGGQEGILYVSERDAVSIRPEPSPTSLRGIEAASASMSGTELLRARIGRMTFSSIRAILSRSGVSIVALAGLLLAAAAVYFFARGLPR